jgi:hypothetical protein
MVFDSSKICFLLKEMCGDGEIKCRQKYGIRVMFIIYI